MGLFVDCLIDKLSVDKFVKHARYQSLVRNAFFQRARLRANLF